MNKSLLIISILFISLFLLNFVKYEDISDCYAKNRYTGKIFAKIDTTGFDIFKYEYRKLEFLKNGDVFEPAYNTCLGIKNNNNLVFYNHESKFKKDDIKFLTFEKTQTPLFLARDNKIYSGHYMHLVPLPESENVDFDSTQGIGGGYLYNKDGFFKYNEMDGKNLKLIKGIDTRVDSNFVLLNDTYIKGTARAYYIKSNNEAIGFDADLDSLNVLNDNRKLLKRYDSNGAAVSMGNQTDYDDIAFDKNSVYKAGNLYPNETIDGIKQKFEYEYR